MKERLSVPIECLSEMIERFNQKIERLSEKIERLSEMIERQNQMIKGLLEMIESLTEPILSHFQNNFCAFKLKKPFFILVPKVPACRRHGSLGMVKSGYERGLS